MPLLGALNVRVIFRGSSFLLRMQNDTKEVCLPQQDRAAVSRGVVLFPVDGLAEVPVQPLLAGPIEGRGTLVGRRSLHLFAAGAHGHRS